jgi:hypothetical protein
MQRADSHHPNHAYRSGKREVPVSGAGLPTQVSYDHLGLWEVKPGLSPLMTKFQNRYAEPHIDYSDTQVCPSDNGFYAGPECPADLSV